LYIVFDELSDFWESHRMSFREKSAWITLISVLFCFGALTIGWMGRSNTPTLHYALLSVIALVVLQVVLHVLAALSNLREARAPRDEREQTFANRARSIGYYVFMIWMIGIIVAAHDPDLHRFDFVFIALFGIVVAAAVVALAQIIQFRRGA
jgi:uncharacterized membrane protein